MCVCATSSTRRPAHPVQKDDHAGTCPLLSRLPFTPPPPTTAHTTTPRAQQNMLACPEYLSKIEAASNGNELLAVFESLNEAIKAKSITLVKSELVGIVKEKKVALKDEWTPAVALEFGGALRAFGGAAEVKERPPTEIIGNPIKDHSHCDSWTNSEFMCPTLSFPSAGRVVGWEFFSRHQTEVRMCVWRGGGQARADHTIIGETLVDATAGANSVELDGDKQIDVQKGDFIGVTQLGTATIPSDLSGNGPHSHRTLNVGSRCTLGRHTYPDVCDQNREYPVAAVFHADE